MRPTRRTIWVLLVAGLILAVLVPLVARWIKQWDQRRRSKWPGPIASMQDLPAVGQAQGPRAPAPWTTTNEEVEAATPEGTKRIVVTYHVNSIGMKLVHVAPGSFRMGLTDREARRLNKPEYIIHHYYTAHQVTLTHGYFIGAFEVTNKQYERYDPAHIGKRPSYQTGPDGGEHPVQPVTWREANEFSRWLTQKEGRFYRLPTEAEWEYACRAGTETRTYWGDNIWNRNKANLGGGAGKERWVWTEDGFMYTAPVGTYEPNPWGLYDMIGNAFEWVSDWFGPFTADPAVDPKGPAAGHCRVGKGGAWNTSLNRISSGIRDGDSPQDIKDFRGLRVVCEAE